MPIKKRPTQSDVARLAGVSRATVSFVLNSTSGGGNIPIGEETRRRVLEAARALNYSPDPVARMLASGSNDLIGVFSYEEVFPLERSDFYYEFILGIERAAASFGKNVILFTRHAVESQRRKVYENGANRLRLADGTVFLGANPDRQELAQLVKEEYPFVYVGRREIPGCQIDWVSSDYLPASVVATRHLLDLGHRRLAFVGSDTHIESNQDKIKGIQSAIQGLAGVTLQVLPEDAVQSAEALAQAIRQDGCTAFLCSHITTYDLALEKLQEAGLSIPQDCSVLSLADAAVNRCFPINPTYVSIDRPRLGEMATGLLIQRIQGNATAPQQVRVPCRFIIGTSTAAPPLINIHILT